jgi:CMP-N-acetylneuraminic acid synthetase
MKLLALIPARGGSKGVPRKNIRDLLGRPLLAWSVEAAKQAAGVDRIVVSTEDEEIAEVARAWGADVPFLRPPELAQDDTPGMEPVLHALSELPEYDWVLLLQPTAPLRTADDIEGIIRFCLEHDAPAAVSVCEVSKHPHWMYRCGADHRLISFTDAPLAGRRQDLPPVYALNGALYLARCDWLLQQRRFVAEETLGYEMPAHRSADIDSAIDWQWVEFLMRKTFSE